MKILFITDNFPPEFNAPATRTYEHCREWIKQGAEVTVLTCVPNFPRGEVFKGYRNKLYQVELMDNIRVVRVWSFITKNEGFLKRIIDYVSFSMSSFVGGLFLKTDIIVATSPHIFSAISGRFLSFFKRKPWIMEVRDLWPESIAAVNAMSRDSMSYRFLENMEKNLYRNAKKIVVVTDSFKTNLVQRGVNENKIVVIKNGVDLNRYTPILRNDLLARQLHLENKFVIGYIGTHGMAHGLDFILRSIKQIKDPSIHFLFIGDGAEKSNLLKLKEQLGLTNITMLPSVPKEDVINYLSLLDVALVNLKKSDTFKTVIPSKVFESSAMEIPVLLGVDGETRELISKYQAGIFFTPEDEHDFLEAIDEIRLPANYSKYRSGAKNLAADFNRKRLANLMFEEISKNGSR